AGIAGEQIERANLRRDPRKAQAVDRKHEDVRHVAEIDRAVVVVVREVAYERRYDAACAPRPGLRRGCRPRPHYGRRKGDRGRLFGADRAALRIVDLAQVARAAPRAEPEPPPTLTARPGEAGTDTRGVAVERARGTARRAC